jgi:nitrate reductase NapE component
MGRWPDNRRSNLIAFALIFVLFPLLAWGCVWIMKR